MKRIDLNCDLGEFETDAAIANDLELLDIITSANIACGGHAGNATSMRRTIIAAKTRNVAIGAHPGYPDPANFGRLSQNLPPEEVESFCFSQISAINSIAKSLNTHLTHVKTHGALYHDTMTSEALAAAIGRAVLRINPLLVMVAFPNAPAIGIWQSQGFRVLTEAFADRTYEPDGSLRKRTLPNAIITDPAKAAAQALTLTFADTLCIHSDTANSAAIARAVRIALLERGSLLASPS